MLYILISLLITALLTAQSGRVQWLTKPPRSVEIPALCGGFRGRTATPFSGSPDIRVSACMCERMKAVLSSRLQVLKQTGRLSSSFSGVSLGHHCCLAVSMKISVQGQQSWRGRRMGQLTHPHTLQTRLTIQHNS